MGMGLNLSLNHSNFIPFANGFRKGHGLYFGPFRPKGNLAKDVLDKYSCSSYCPTWMRTPDLM